MQTVIVLLCCQVGLTAAIGIGLYRWVQRTDPPAPRVLAPVTEPAWRMPTLKGEGITLHLMSVEGDLRHEVHLSNGGPVPAFYAYGGRIYKQSSGQTDPDVVAYVAQEPSDG